MPEPRYPLRVDHMVGSPNLTQDLNQAYVNINDLAERIVDADTVDAARVAADTARLAAAAAAIRAADALRDVVGLSGAGVVGLALDTDGQPYFDPTITGTTTTLALGVDTDGVPYLIGA